LENLTLQLEKGALDYFAKLGCDGRYGQGYRTRLPAEGGSPRRRISISAPVEAKEKIIVGVNEFAIEEEPPLTLYIDESVAQQQTLEVKDVKGKTLESGSSAAIGRAEKGCCTAASRRVQR